MLELNGCLLNLKGDKMIKRFCDMCNTEMIVDDTPNMGRHKASISVNLNEFTSISIEVVSHRSDVKNSDVCKYCIFDTIYELDDRPKEKTKEKTIGAGPDSNTKG